VRDVTLTDRHGTSHDFGTFIVTHYVYYSTYGDDHVSLETKVYGNGNPNTAYPEYSHPHVANAGPCTGAANRDFMLNQIRSGLGFGVPAIMDNMLRSYNYMDAFRPLETWDEELPEDEICEYCEATLDGDDYCLVTCHETGRSGCSSCFIYSEDNDAYYHPDECEPTEYYSHPSNRWRAGRYVPTGQVISCVDCDRPMEDDPYLVPPDQDFNTMDLSAVTYGCYATDDEGEHVCFTCHRERQTEYAAEHDITTTEHQPTPQPLPDIQPNPAALIPLPEVPQVYTNRASAEAVDQATPSPSPQPMSETETLAWLISQ
jgi:hypothetical protein